MINNSFCLDIESRVLAVIVRYLYNDVRDDSTQKIIYILSHYASMRAVEMSRVFYANRKSTDASVRFSTNFCSARIAQITRALCVQNDDKTYTLASREAIEARYVAQRERVETLSRARHAA